MVVTEPWTTKDWASDPRGWATRLLQRAQHRELANQIETKQPPTPEALKHTHRAGFITPLHDISKRTFEKHIAKANSKEIQVHAYLNDRLNGSPLRQRRQQDIVLFPLCNNLLTYRAANRNATVVVQVDYGDDTRRYYQLYLSTDKWDYLTKRDAQLCGTLPSELTYYDEPTHRPVRHIRDLTTRKGSQVTERGSVLMTYTARVTAKKQFLVHVEVRDPFKSNGGQNYYLPTGTTVRKLRSLHGHTNAVWKCQATKALLHDNIIIDDLPKRCCSATYNGHACVVVINNDISVSEEETEGDDSEERDDGYHPGMKRKRSLQLM